MVQYDLPFALYNMSSYFYSTPYAFYRPGLLGDAPVSPVPTLEGAIPRGLTLETTGCWLVRRCSLTVQEGRRTPGRACLTSPTRPTGPTRDGQSQEARRGTRNHSPRGRSRSTIDGQKLAVNSFSQKSSSSPRHGQIFVTPCLPLETIKEGGRKP